MRAGGAVVFQGLGSRVQDITVPGFRAASGSPRVRPDPPPRKCSRGAAGSPSALPSSLFPPHQPSHQPSLQVWVTSRQALPAHLRPAPALSPSPPSLGSAASSLSVPSRQPPADGAGPLACHPAHATHTAIPQTPGDPCRGTLARRLWPISPPTHTPPPPHTHPVQLLRDHPGSVVNLIPWCAPLGPAVTLLRPRAPLPLQRPCCAIAPNACSTPAVPRIVYELS